MGEATLKVFPAPPPAWRQYSRSRSRQFHDHGRHGYFPRPQHRKQTMTRDRATATPVAVAVFGYYRSQNPPDCFEYVHRIAGRNGSIPNRRGTQNVPVPNVIHINRRKSAPRVRESVAIFAKPY